MRDGSDAGAAEVAGGLVNRIGNVEGDQFVTAEHFVESRKSPV